MSTVSVKGRIETRKGAYTGTLASTSEDEEKKKEGEEEEADAVDDDDASDSPGSWFCTDTPDTCAPAVSAAAAT